MTPAYAFVAGLVTGMALAGWMGWRQWVAAMLGQDRLRVQLIEAARELQRLRRRLLWRDRQPPAWFPEESER
jgi:hypothetical protein